MKMVPRSPGARYCLYEWKHASQTAIRARMNDLPDLRPHIRKISRASEVGCSVRPVHSRKMRACSPDIGRPNSALRKANHAVHPEGFRENHGLKKSSEATADRSESGAAGLAVRWRRYRVVEAMAAMLSGPRLRGVSGQRLTNANGSQVLFPVNRLVLDDFWLSRPLAGLLGEPGCRPT